MNFSSAVDVDLEEVVNKMEKGQWRFRVFIKEKLRHKHPQLRLRGCIVEVKVR